MSGHLPSGARAACPSLRLVQEGDLLPLFLLRYEAANTRRSYEHALRSFFGGEPVTLARAALAPGAKGW